MWLYAHTYIHIHAKSSHKMHTYADRNTPIQTFIHVHVFTSPRTRLTGAARIDLPGGLATERRCVGTL